MVDIASVLDSSHQLAWRVSIDSRAIEAIGYEYHYDMQTYMTMSSGLVCTASARFPGLPELEPWPGEILP